MKFFARRRYEKAVNRALELLQQGKKTEARDELLQALADATRAFGDRGVDVATVRYALATSELDAGKLDVALEHALASDRAMEGVTVDPDKREEAPSVARIRALVASILEKQGASADVYDPALERWAEAAKAEGDDESAGTALNQLGLALGRRGDREGASAKFLEALAVRTRKFGAKGLPTLETMYNAATFRDATRTLDVVAADLQTVVGALEGAKDERSRELFESALHNLGVLRDEQNDVAAAEDAYGRALALREARLGKDHVSLRATLVRLAQLHHREGKLVHALSLYERALAIAKRDLGEEHPTTVAIDAWRAELTQGLGPGAVRRSN